MTSSGMKRGLAATAVSALAVTGLPFLTATANATTIDAQVTGANATLFTPGAAASIKNDGQDTKVHLLAGAGADVTAVTFQYKLAGGAFQDIASVTSRNNDGAFSYDWDVPAAIQGATIVTNLKVTKKDNTTADVAGPNVTLNAAGAAVNSVNLGGDDAPLRVFQQPYGGANNKQLASVSGTTSSTSAADVVNLSWLKGDGTAGGQGTAPVSVEKDATTGTFAGVLDLSGYAWDVSANPVDQVVVKASLGSDDAEAYTIKKQVITGITASAKATKVKVGDSTDVTIKVTDQDDQPIAGAQVYDDLNDTLVGYTDADGVVRVNGALPTAGKGAHEYYANATGTTAYEPGFGDKKAGTVTVSEYTASPKSLQAKSVDGPAFDFDEEQTGDLTVTVADEADAAYSAALQKIDYTWTVTPYDGSAAKTTKPLTASIVNGATANVPLPSVNDFAANTFEAGTTSIPAGTWVLTAGREGDTGTGNGAIAAKQLLTVEAGNAQIVFDKASPEQALAGTTENVTGKVVLDNGTTGLVGRDIALTYTAGTEQWKDASGAPQSQAGDAAFPAGANNTPARGTTRTVKTLAGGVFSVDVNDPKVAANQTQHKELGGVVSAASTALKVDTDNANTQKVEGQGVDFLLSVATDKVALGDYSLVIGDQGVPTPGRPVSLPITVTNKDGDALANQEVTITVDRGMIVATDKDGNLVPETATSEFGDWKAVAGNTTTTVKTDADGMAHIVVGMEKDTDFDDDGMATQTVSITAGGKSASQEITYFSGNDHSTYDPITGDWIAGSVSPLNPGSVSLKFAPAAQQDSSVLPDARTGQGVAYDLVATDQFGNRVKDGARIVVDGQRYDWEDSQFLGEDAAVWLSSANAGDQSPIARWENVSTHTWAKTDPTPKSGHVPGDDETGSTTKTAMGDTIHWYAMSPQSSSFALTHSGGGTFNVGSTVTEIVTVKDQKGQAVNGAYVEFIRTGPGDKMTGDSNFAAYTNANGQAVYTFAGSDAGVAQVSATVYTDAPWNGGTVLGHTNGESITFAAPAPARAHINAGLAMSNGRKGGDIAFVNAPSNAAGAVVKVYKVTPAGKKVLVAQKRANAAGNARFVIADKNGAKFTKYVAFVGRTAKTFADWTPMNRVR